MRMDSLIDTPAPHPLPDGWRWARLGDVCDFAYGEGLPAHARAAGDIPVYGSNGIIGFHNASITQGPTLIIGRKGSIGEVHYSSGACWPIDTTYYVQETKIEADLRWLEYALRKLDLPALNKAAAVPGLNRVDAYKLLLPVPPLAEQRRIAALLRERLAAVERARAAAAAQLAAARALPAAYLRAVFESDEAQAWPRVRLADVAEIGSGITLGRNLNGALTRSVPYLRVANVKDGYLDLTGVYETAATPLEIEKCRLTYGDLLLTEGGDPDKLGRGTFWQDEIEECIHQNHIFRVRFNLSQYVPAFVSAQVGSLYGKAYFLAHAKQTTGIATINQRVLGDFPLMSPPFEVQDHTANLLTVREKQMGVVLSHVGAQRGTINALPAALLRQAFRGEL